LFCSETIAFTPQSCIACLPITIKEKLKCRSPRENWNVGKLEGRKQNVFAANHKHVLTGELPFF